MKFTELQIKLGLLAHETATAEFRIKYRSYHLLYHNVLGLPNGRTVPLASWGSGPDIGSALRRKDLGDPYLGWILLHLQTFKPARGAWIYEPSDGSSRQPDLAAVELQTAYEIKPDNPAQQSAGRRQLSVFIDLLQRANRDCAAFSSQYPSPLFSGLPTKMWTRGTNFLPTPTSAQLGSLGNVRIMFRLCEPGIILWRADAAEEELRRRATSIAADAVRLVPTPPSNADEAELKANELLQKHPSIGVGVSPLVVKFGLAAVAVGLAAALVASSPLWAGAAIALAFAFKLSEGFRRSTNPILLRST